MTDVPMIFSDELNALDHLLFRGENSPATRSAMVSIMALQTAPDFTVLKQRVERASRVYVRLRQKVVEPSNALIAPRWVVDPDFNLDYHLRRTRLPQPGSKNELFELCEQIAATPFDICRPLWEFYFVEGLGLTDAKAALIIKIHHAVSDGVGAVALLQELLELEPDAAEPEMPLTPVPEEFDAEEITRQGFRKVLGQLVPTVRSALDTAERFVKKGLSEPMDTLGDVLHYGESTKRVLGTADLHFSPLLQGRSLNRDLGFLEVPLAELRRATKSAGVTINDGLLAAVSIALGKYHRAKNVQIEQLSMSMPVNTRKAGETEGGNHFSAARLSLPLNQPDPVACMHEVSKRVKSALNEPALTLVEFLAPVVSRVSNSMMQSMAGNLNKPEIQISNVPGAPVPMYIAGCKITKIIPFGPVPDVAVMIGMVSYNGTCFVGIRSDRAAIKNFDLFEQCLRDGFAEVLSSVTRTAHKNNVTILSTDQPVTRSRKKATGKRPRKAGSKAPLKVSAKQPVKKR